MKVIVYSTPTCPFCIQVKKYFDENKVEYADVDVSADQKAAEEMINKTGQMGVPVIVIGEGDDEEIVIGFDKKKLEKLLGL